MKRFTYSLACWLLLASQLCAGIVVGSDPGQTLYARVNTSATAGVAVALVEGTANGVGFYRVTDAQLVAAGLSAVSPVGGHPFLVLAGTPSLTANDLQLFSGSLDWNGTTEAPTAVTPLANGTAQAGAAATIQLAAAHTFGDDILNGTVVNITAGVGAGQSRVIVDYTSANDTASVTPNWTTNPDATSVYHVSGGSVNISAVLGSAAEAVDLGDLATQASVDNVSTKLGTPAVTIAADIAGIEGGGGAELSDVDLGPIPTSRLFVLTTSDEDGLVCELAKSIRISDGLTKIGVVFSVDLPANRSIRTVDSVTILVFEDGGTADGITIGDLGRDRTQGKVEVTMVTAGTYELEMEVTYDTGDSATGKFTIIVP